MPTLPTLHRPCVQRNGVGITEEQLRATLEGQAAAKMEVDYVRVWGRPAAAAKKAG